MGKEGSEKGFWRSIGEALGITEPKVEEKKTAEEPKGKKQTFEQIQWYDYHKKRDDYVKHPNGGGVVHKTTVVDPTAKIDAKSIVGANGKIGAGVVIGPYTVLSSEIQIGDNAKIGSFVSMGSKIEIGNGAEIGDCTGANKIQHASETEGTCRLQSDIKIGHRAVIGKRIFISKNSFIGDDSNVSSGNSGKQILIGENASIGKNVMIEAEGIGANTQICDGVQLLCSNVKFNPGVTLGNDLRFDNNTDFQGKGLEIGYPVSMTRPKEPTFGNSTTVVNTKEAAEPPVVSPPKPSTAVSSVSDELHKVRPPLELSRAGAAGRLDFAVTASRSGRV